MKKVLIYVLIVLSLLILGAHFMRYGNWAGVFGALEWGRTLYELVQIRAAQGQPFTRMALILGTVAVVSLLSALLFQSSVLKRIYRLEDSDLTG